MKKIKATVRQSETDCRIWFVTISDEDAITKCNKYEWFGFSANHALHRANQMLQVFGYNAE